MDTFVNWITNMGATHDWFWPAVAAVVLTAVVAALMKRPKIVLGAAIGGVIVFFLANYIK